MKIKKFLAVMLAASMFYSSTAAFAQKSSVPSPDPDPEEQIAKISPMRKGNRAPFTGVLFSPRATATVVTEIETFEERMKIEIDKAVRDATAKKQFELNETDSKCTTAKTILQADIDAKSSRIKQLSKDLSDAQDAAANAPSRLLWTGIGVLAGAATAVLITFAVNQASK